MSSGQNLTSRGVGYAINGQRESGTEILLDGVENVAIFGAAVGEDVPIDSVQEYSVITNNFSAEYGRASGGVVNLTTKAGTNSIHGSAWEFNRLSGLHRKHLCERRSQLGCGPWKQPSGLRGPDQRQSLPQSQGHIHAQPVRIRCRRTHHQEQAFHFREHEWTRVRSAASETEEIFDPAFHRLDAGEYSGLLQNLWPDRLAVCGSGDHVWGSCCGGSPTGTSVLFL